MYIKGCPFGIFMLDIIDIYIKIDQMCYMTRK